MRQEEVEAVLETPGRHECTFRRGGDEWVLASYEVHVPYRFHPLDLLFPRKGWDLPYRLLFANARLKAIVRFAVREADERVGGRNDAHVCDEGNLRRLERITCTEGLSADDVAREVEAASRYRPGQLPSPLVALGWLTYATTCPFRAGAHAKNLELVRRYNGHEVKPGMSPAEVRSIFEDDAPTRELRCGDELLIVYGDDRQLRDVSWSDRFSPVGVVFRESTAIRVYSGDYVFWALESFSTDASTGVDLRR